jgi:ribosomal protein S1
VADTTSTIKNQKSNKAPTTMAELMASHKSTFVSPHKSEVLEGTITKLTSSEILVDIGAKTEAVVLEKDKRILRNLLSNLKPGDKVTVSVLNPESDLGNPVVSLRRFIDDRLWVRLNSLLTAKEILDVNVDEITKGGFLVSTRDGISGFLPNSQTLFTESGQDLLGKTLKVMIIELNKPLHKIIFSQKSAMGDEDFNLAIKGLRVEQKIDSVISNIAPFGIFTSIQIDGKYIEGFVHISEIAWEKTENIGKDYKVGDKITAQITGFDKEAKRVNLSLKRLIEDPFAELLKNYTPDKKVEGTVSKAIASGILVDLEKGVEGFIRKEKIPPTVSYSVGDSIIATVSEVDGKKHRVILVPVLKEKPIGYR